MGIAACVVPVVALRDDGRVVGSGAPALLLGGLADLALNLGPVLEHGQVMSFRVPSLLQPLAILVTAAVCFWAVFVARRLVTAPLPRRASVFAAGLAVLAVAAVASPGLGPQLQAGFSGWLLKSDPWLASVSEFQPLFRLGRPPLEALLFYLGVPGLLSAPLLAIAVFSAKTPLRAPLLAFAWLFGAMAVLTMLQMRFGRVLGPLGGAAAALGACSLLARFIGNAAKHALALGAVGAAILGSDAESRREPSPPRLARWRPSKKPSTCWRWELDPPRPVTTRASSRPGTSAAPW